VRDVFIYLVFPGFIFTAGAGMLASWLDRKLTARVQWRVGPPWYQSFADVVKLLNKEIIVPRGSSRFAFVASPLIGFAGVVLLSSIVGSICYDPGRTFVGDLIVIVYLLMLPSLSLILGGAASRNPLASLGMSREMKLMIAYELPFILAVVAAVVKGGVTIRLGDVVAVQRLHGAFLWYPSGILAFIAALFCMQAKLGFVPFDVAEAETEINGGPIIEYSGGLLALFKLMKMMLMITVPVLLLSLFGGGISFRGWGLPVALCKYLPVLLFITVLRNTNPRVRIDQALKFFWGPVTAIALLAVVMAFLGR
jgi:NADH-quinone oxidoreductase subunit H